MAGTYDAGFAFWFRLDRHVHSWVLLVPLWLSHHETCISDSYYFGHQGSVSVTSSVEITLKFHKVSSTIDFGAWWPRAVECIATVDLCPVECIATVDLCPVECIATVDRSEAFPASLVASLGTWYLVDHGRYTPVLDFSNVDSKVRAVQSSTRAKWISSK
ncbi:hypothetical protein CFP56_008412 [Quercus suber]|uniref:Uncharacterized protein n=1 Tax=Quercus suber TaxID=58331 RepID=A0AAW0I5N0_QUESU